MKTTLFLFMIFFAAACTKTEQPIDPPVNPPITPNTGKPTGIIYLKVEGDFVKINSNDSTIIWTTSNLDLFGSSENPLTFDSNTFYYGNYSGLTAYSTLTGTPLWRFPWAAFSNAISYREPAFKDSLVFVSFPTSVWQHAYLYCLSNSTGLVHWKKEIDKGYVDLPFNTEPMVIDNKVIVLTRDEGNHLRLNAYTTEDGAPVWTSDVNDSLSFKLIFKDGKIFSRSKRNLYCYNSSDGALLWQTDLQQTSFQYAYTYFEADKVVMVKVDGDLYTTVILNTANGSILKTITITAPTHLPGQEFAWNGCNYANNILYVSAAHTIDTVSIKAFDLSKSTLKWERRYAYSEGIGFDPLLTDKYLIFPINNSYPAGKSIMYFIDLNGKDITGIPFTGNYTNGFVYTENNTMFKLEHRYTNR